jgi:hypothetical protein
MVTFFVGSMYGGKRATEAIFDGIRGIAAFAS